MTLKTDVYSCDKLISVLDLTLEVRKILGDPASSGTNEASLFRKELDNSDACHSRLRAAAIK